MNNNMKDRKYFIIFCVLSIVLVGIIFGINSIMRGTNASFGGITGELTVTYKVTYYSNWPDANIENTSNECNGTKIYQVLNNMYEVPEGYKFLGWGTEPNGVVVYNEGQVMSLSNELNLYAIWGLVDSEEEDNKDDNTEETIISYGDTNLDGIVNENDYLLIDNYLIDNSILTGQGLTNADVNAAGNIDSDIIKQTCLGTEGYVGFLPEKPILIYELYVKGESTDKEDTSEDNTGGGNTSSSNGSGSSSTGGGSGTTGSGNSSTGSGSGSNKPNGGSNKKPNVNNNNNNNNNKQEELDKPKEELPKIYEFKFMDGTMEYAITKCDILEDGTCKLVLPNTVPSKTGFIFKGWSLEEDCSKHIIKETMNVNSSATYYACYTEIIQKKQEKNTSNTWIIVGGIWILSSTLIYRIIKQFKIQKGNN